MIHPSAKKAGRSVAEREVDGEPLRIGFRS